MRRSEACAVLGLVGEWGPMEVKRQYRRLVAVAHPDVGGEVEAFRRVQAAYELLEGCSSADPGAGDDGLSWSVGGRDSDFRVATGAMTLVADDVDHPNGLAFSPDESILYVIESRADPRNILAYDVEGAALRNRRVFIRTQPGETPDGFRVDTDGNLWCGWGMTPEFDGVRIFNKHGVPIGHIHLPERCANLCFGGRHRNRLFMAAAQSLFSVYVNAQGVAGG